MSVAENMKQITDLASQLAKEQSSAANPILPQDSLFCNKGWQCPICGRVYSPTTPMCFYCGNKSESTQVATTQSGNLIDARCVKIENTLDDLVKRVYGKD